MSDIIDFKSQRIAKIGRKLFENLENMDDLQVVIQTYKENLYFYTCGQSGTEYLGWLKGVEYMLEYMGIDYMGLRKEVADRINTEDRTIVNDYFFTEE
jgi:hypothetical protein